VFILAAAERKKRGDLLVPGCRLLRSVFQGRDHKIDRRFDVSLDSPAALADSIAAVRLALVVTLFSSGLDISFLLVAGCFCLYLNYAYGLCIVK
jgi:hypothetical protein